MPREELWIGTSWKMTKTLAETREYFGEIRQAAWPQHVQVFVLPPLTSLAAAAECVGEGPPLLLGAQNAHWGPEGPWTGEVSMAMVRDAGALIVEIGHSERRKFFGETDAVVARKARAATDQGLTPLICVGEPADVRAAGGAEDFVLTQTIAALSQLDGAEVKRVLIAYEPVWAIGEQGLTAAAEQVAPVTTMLAQHLRERSDGAGGRGVLYGGSVNEGNAAQLIREAYVDGLFVGRAAWRAEGLLRLIDIAASARLPLVPPAGVTAGT